MTRFHYEGKDAAGKVRTGQIDALTTDAAILDLSRQGVRVDRISSQAPPTAARASSPKPPIRTEVVLERDLALLYSGMANQIRSGISPAKATASMATTVPKPVLRQALTTVAQETAEGRAMSDAMARYPDLFAPGDVGAVKAGETGGYLAEALTTLSQTYESAASFRRWTLPGWWMLWLTMLGVPLVLMVASGVKNVIESFDELGQGPAFDVLGQGVVDGLFGLPGVLLLLAIVGVVAIKRALRSPRWRDRRHRVAASSFLTSKKVKNESISVFTWHLGKLSSAGLSPNQTWAMAAQAVPNTAVSERLLADRDRLREDSKLSEALAASDLISPETASIVQTGEQTGTVPTALDDVARLGMEESRAAESWFKAKAGCWLVLASFVVTALLFGFLLRGYFETMFDAILGP